MRKIELEELRTIQLDILSEVDLFCRQNGIVYSLCGGTLLGAVRHKGYIPWDDDIDLMMPRADYERFSSTFRSSKSELIDLRKDGRTIEICLKVSRKGTLMRDTQFGRELWGINIDIFPIDGAPESFADHCREISRLRRRLPVVCPFYKSVAGNRLQWLVKYLLKRMSHPFYANILKIKEEIERLACSCPLDSSPRAGVILGSYGEREVVDRSVFESMTELPFEGKDYPSISNFDLYLSSIYGNYMELPPPEKRITHHLYDAFAESDKAL